MQVGVDVTYIHTNIGGRDLSGFGDIATFKNSQFFLWTKWRMTLIWCVVGVLLLLLLVCWCVSQVSSALCIVIVTVKCIQPFSSD